MTNRASQTNSPVQETNKRFQALSHHRRRSVLRILDQSQEMTLSELADKIAQRRYEGSIEDLTSQEIDAVKADLYHNHIPMLIEADLIDNPEEYYVKISDEADTDVYVDILRMFV